MVKPWAAPGRRRPSRPLRRPARPAGWSSGPSGLRPPRPQTPGCGGGRRRHNPAPSAGSGPGRSLTNQNRGTRASDGDRTGTSAGSAGLTCSQRDDADGRLAADQLVPHGLQNPQNPSHRAVAAADQNPEPGNLPEGVEAAAQEHVLPSHQQVQLASGPEPEPEPSPCQRASVGDVKHLVGVQQLPEAVQQLSALQPAALRVHKHQQGADCVPQLLALQPEPEPRETSQLEDRKNANQSGETVLMNISG